MRLEVWAGVPVKEFAGAKQRLAPLLTPARRTELVTAMLEDVLDALAGAPLAGVMVNTLDPTARALALRHGARVVTAEARTGHTGAVTAMARILAAEAKAAMLTCPGDIPALTAADIAAVIAAHGETHGRMGALTIVPAHDERGSNTILVSPPDAMEFQFGDDSFVPHLATARRLGLAPRIVHVPGIALDIDNPEDARAFLSAPHGRHTRAWALLAEWIGGSRE